MNFRKHRCTGWPLMFLLNLYWDGIRGFWNFFGRDKPVDLNNPQQSRPIISCLFWILSIEIFVIKVFSIHPFLRSRFILRPRLLRLIEISRLINIYWDFLRDFWFKSLDTYRDFLDQYCYWVKVLINVKFPPNYEVSIDF